MPGELFDRLEMHLEKKNYKKQDADRIAAATLTRAGEMSGGQLTPKGKHQQALGPAGRATARKAKARSKR
jgi:hypothetical protein